MTSLSNSKTGLMKKIIFLKKIIEDRYKTIDTSGPLQINLDFLFLINIFPREKIEFLAFLFPKEITFSRPIFLLLKKFDLRFTNKVFTPLSEKPKAKVLITFSAPPPPSCDAKKYSR